MASKTKFQAIRGTRDLLPPDTALWNRVEQTAREVFGTFGFGEIRPPIFEPTDLFARAVGGETDIVSKEMYAIANDLDAARRLVLGQTVFPFAKREHSEVTRTLIGIQILIEAARTAVNSRELDATPEVNSAVTSMEVALQSAIERWTRGVPAGDESKFEEFLTQTRQYANKIAVESISLRPEATASVCRAYIEHNMQQWPQPVKLYYLGPMFRRERPQKGRYRQFYQIGAEVLEKQVASGEWRVASTKPEEAASARKELSKDAAVDAEVIEMVMTFFSRLQLEGVQLDINSIGHAAENCRRGYVEKLRAELTKVKEKLGADSQRRIETNPLRVLDSKLEHEQPIIEKLPRIADHLCDECKAHYEELKRQLDLRRVPYQENWRLVRGLDYYMRTTFEITASGLGSQNAVCGGGRYDGLVELLGGPPTKGIGFAIGEDRLILSLQESKKEVASGEWRVASSRLDVYIAWMGANTYATAIRAAKTLRAAGISVDLPPAEQKFGKALERASKLGARFALILGDNEVQSGEWTLKNLADGSQQKLTEPQLLDFLKRA